MGVDAAGNVEEMVSAYAFETLDTTPPKLVGSVPSIGVDVAELSLAINEDGRAHYAVLLASEAPPTAVSVQDSTTGAGPGAVGAVVIAGGTRKSVDLNTLTPKTPYVVYYVAVDNVGNVGILEEAPFTTDYHSTLEITAKKVEDVTERGARLHATVSERGQVHFVVLLASESAPEPAAIVEPEKQGGAGVGGCAGVCGTITAMTAGVSKSVAVAGLNPSTKYTCHIVGQELGGVQKVQVTSTLVALETVDLTPPRFVVNKILSVSEADASFTIALNERGTVWWVVSKTHADVDGGGGGAATPPPPSSIDVKEGRATSTAAAASVPVIAHGIMDLSATAPGSTRGGTITDLLALGKYVSTFSTIEVCVEDGH